VPGQIAALAARWDEQIRWRASHAQAGGVVAGDTEVLALLNEQLTSELTAVNQYFLHSKLQANWGFTELAKHTRAESFDEMRHAEAITDRILLLDGLPNYQRLFSLRVGESVREQFESDLAIEIEVVKRLRPGIVLCRDRQDSTSANLLEMIMADEETHVDYLQTQLELMDTLGDQLFLAQCLSTPPQ
jgi:bacterioferritin